ncbi:facilitated trehalose transporter Tret1-like [Prorops nasuta]|uniref:facilitated trehalose transporter Tret1-like n=1 Tax=Prorops nasuta TaxID=863751 RepID=UPI0034CDD237
MKMTDSEKGKYMSPEGRKTWEYLTISCCSIFVLCIGCIIGWNSPSAVILMSPESEIPATASDVASLMAVLAMGHLMAPPFSILAVDRIGRKNTILISSVPLLVSWSMVIFAKSVEVLYVARFLAGLTLGVCICVSPMYLGEVSSSATRGAAGALLAIMYNLGILVAFVAGPYLSIAAMASCFLALAVVFVASFWFMPLSPYYLVLRGRKEEAEEVLTKLRGKPDVSEELEAIVASLRSDNEKGTDDGGGGGGGGGFKQIFSLKKNRRAFVIVLLFNVMYSFGGYLVVMTYGQLIFKETGSPLPDHTANILVGAMQLVPSIVTTFVVDKLGRKPLILASGFVAGLCNLAIGSFFYAREYLQQDVSSYSLVPFIASMVLVFSLNCGINSLQIIIMSEIFATDVKALSSCLLGMCGGLFACVSAKLYIALAITWAYGHSLPFISFFLVMWISVAIILYLLPETKGKSFAQIQRELEQ